MKRRLVAVVVGLALIAGAAACGPSGDRAPRRFDLRGVPGGMPWRGTLELDRLSFGEQDDLRVRVRASVASSLLAPYRGDLTAIHVAVVGERMYDGQGHPHRWSNAFISTVLTSTGMPVETHQLALPVGKLGHPWGSPVEWVHEVRPVPRGIRWGSTRIDAEGRIPLRGVPAGYYRLRTELFLEFADGPLIPAAMFRHYAEGLMLALTVRDMARVGSGILRSFGGEEPMVRIGDPARPKAIWTLLTQRPIHGVRGVVADEDRPYVAISNRFRFPTSLIVQPGEYDLAPDCPLDMAHDYFERPVTEEPRRFIGSGGRLDFTVRAPNGRVVRRGSYPIKRYGRTGPDVEGSLVVPLTTYGEYVVRLTGEMVDRYGWTYDAGGTYRIWVAEPLTFSTSVKPGSPFLVGASFPNKVLVNPPVPARIRYDVLRHPGSDAARAARTVIDGVASPFGYFISLRPEHQVRFDEPGEYLSRLTAEYRDPSGRYFRGEHASAGVVAALDGATRAHGRKALEVAPDLSGVLARDRYPMHRQGKFGDLHSNRVDCIPYALPFHSGDVLVVGENRVGGANIAGELSLEPVAPAVREAIARRFPRGAASAFGYLYRGGGPSRLPETIRRAIRNAGWTLFFPLWDPATMTEMSPLLSGTPEGWHPASFPERRDVTAYYYLSAIRPGLLPKVIVADSSVMAPYWATTGSRFDEQFNVGGQGDLAGDIYRFQGGTVWMDAATGIRSYAAYSSAGIIEPAGRYDNRVVAPFSEPLLRESGRTHPAIFGVDPAIILTPGQTLPIAGLVVPTVAAPVRVTITDPAGRVTVVEGSSSPLGTFWSKDSLYPVTLPGVYRVHVEVGVGDKTGDVVGSGDGTYNCYCVDPTSPRVLRADLPPYSEWDPAGDLVLPLTIDPALRHARLTYSVEMPGVLMDEGALDLDRPAFTYRFSPRQFRRQFPNYDWFPSQGQGWETVDTVVFSFFVEGTSSDGRRVTNAVRILLRGKNVYNPSATVPGRP